MALISSARRVQLHVTNDSGGTMMMRVGGDGRGALSKPARQLLLLVGMNTSAQVGHDHRFGHTLDFDAPQLNELVNGSTIAETIEARIHFHDVTDSSKSAAATRTHLDIQNALTSVHAIMLAKSLADIHEAA